MESTYAVVLSTCSTEKEAKIIIRSLLEKKLAACIQIFPIKSFYVWKDEICNDSEVMILIKCKQTLFAEIKEDILRNHTYETPEIILLPIVAGFDPYLTWINDVSK